MSTAPRKQRQDQPRSVRVLLAGNPNSGKTSVFNALTGAHQRVGNYPGVTVERREGGWRRNGRSVVVRDLPGTYSLSPFSPEEDIARRELLSPEHDVVVIVVDSTVLRRSFMFMLQVMQLGRNCVLCLNMADEARRAGQELDLTILESLLGVPVIQTSANHGEGIAQLREIINSIPDQPQRKADPLVSTVLNEPIPIDGREIDAEAAATDRMQRLSRVADILIERSVTREARPDHHIRSNRIDAVVAHRIWGLPIFLAVMYSIFSLTFSLGAAPMGWIESGIAWLSATVTSLWPGDLNSPLYSLLVDGIIAGVGGVLVFLPNIVLLFLGLSLMEDTGYMARGAYIMDRLLNRVGLHGKSFLPLVTGFGCSIPGIMSTRTIENERDRLATIFVLPLMSCGARLPIWLLIIPAFFPSKWQGPMMGAVYLFGILLAMGLSLLLRGTLLKGDPTPFMLELPPYRMPTLKAVLTRIVDRSGLYLRKAGTVILAISVILWILTTFPRPTTFEVDAQLAAGQTYTAQEIDGLKSAEAMRYSVAGRLGRLLEPVFKPLGFDWRLVTASIGAFAAKEVFVSQMNIVYALGEGGNAGNLRERLKADYSPLVGISLIIFLLVGTPCMATVAVTRRETGSWKWALLQFGGLTGLAYVLSLVVYNAGRLLI